MSEVAAADTDDDLCSLRCLLRTCSHHATLFQSFHILVELVITVIARTASTTAATLRERGVKHVDSRWAPLRLPSAVQHSRTVHACTLRKRTSALIRGTKRCRAAAETARYTALGPDLSPVCRARCCASMALELWRLTSSLILQHGARFARQAMQMTCIFLQAAPDLMAHKRLLHCQQSRPTKETRAVPYDSPVLHRLDAKKYLFWRVVRSCNSSGPEGKEADATAAWLAIARDLRDLRAVVYFRHSIILTRFDGAL